jgi:hypothetical protein
VDSARRVQWISPTVTAGAWYTFTGTFDGSTWRIYQDGVEKASNAVGAFGTTTAPLTFGGRSVNGSMTNFSPVDIESVAVWSGRALSASAVWQHHDQSRRGYPDLLRRRRQQLFDVPAAAGGGGNRRRRVLLCGRR